MTDKCSNCEQIVKEDKVLRKALNNFQKLYVEVVNENLRLRNILEVHDIYFDRREGIGGTRV